MKHGTPTAYHYWRCRCDECREAARVRRAKVRAAARARPLAADDPRHGRQTTYQNWGCRCLACTEAAIIANAKRRNGSAIKSLGANA